MYSYEDKKRAVELYIKYDKSPTAVINELGYPSIPALKQWYRSYVEAGDVPLGGEYGRYTYEDKKRAVDHYLEHGRCNARTRRALGYPSADILARWIDELAPGGRKSREKQRVFTYDEKREAVIDLETRRVPAQEVAAAYGVTRGVLYKWKSQLLGEEADMGDGRAVSGDPAALVARIEELEEQVRRLQMRKDILEGTIEILGKDQGADPKRLTNREKAELIEALRPEYKLKNLLEALSMPKSSYQYQAEAMARPDKYADLRVRVCTIFEDSKGRYGYRRVHLELRNEGVRVSEKVVARLMREEGLVAKRSKRRRGYSSYAGEISEAPENLLRDESGAHDFSADAPNRKWLTDITEFRIPAGKVYLSPIIDCFDGMVVSWGMSTSPNAELANTTLEAAAATLNEGEKPTCHSDRGCHYRWPGWIALCDEHGLVRSMSRKGCSPDNSACEGFFGRLKVEAFYGRSWSGWTVDEFMDEIDGYIRWYNERRIKKSLGGMSPLQYRETLGLAA